MEVELPAELMPTSGKVPGIVPTSRPRVAEVLVSLIDFEMKMTSGLDLWGKREHRAREVKAVHCRARNDMLRRADLRLMTLMTGTGITWTFVFVVAMATPKVTEIGPWSPRPGRWSPTSSLSRR